MWYGSWRRIASTDGGVAVLPARPVLLYTTTEMESVKSFVIFLSVFLLVMTFYHKVTEVYYDTVLLRQKVPGQTLGPPVNNHVCTDIFEIGKKSKNMSSIMDLAVRVIARKKSKNLFVSFPFYEVLGYESPSMIREVSDGSGLAGTNLTQAQVSSLSWRPRLPCVCVSLLYLCMSGRKFYTCCPVSCRYTSYVYSLMYTHTS